MSCNEQKKKELRAIKVVASYDTRQRILVRLMQTMVLAMADYRLGLLTLSKTQTYGLDRIQNKAVRTALVAQEIVPL